MKIELGFSRITRKKQDEDAFLGAPFGAVIHFGNGYYWEIPATRNDAVKIAELAEDVAGQQLDGIVFFGDYPELAILCREGKSGATSVAAAFQGFKVCA